MCGENIDSIREMISNLYKIKWGEEESKYKKIKNKKKKRKWWRKCKGKVETSWEIKRPKEKGKVWENVTVSMD